LLDSQENARAELTDPQVHLSGALPHSIVPDWGLRFRNGGISGVISSLLRPRSVGNPSTAIRDRRVMHRTFLATRPECFSDARIQPLAAAFPGKRVCRFREGGPSNVRRVGPAGSASDAMANNGLCTGGRKVTIRHKFHNGNRHEDIDGRPSPAHKPTDARTSVRTPSRNTDDNE